MDGRQLLILILVLIIAGVIMITIAVEAIRKKDFRDQVSGKKPEHKPLNKQKFSYDKPKQENPQIAVDREVLRTKSGQNLLGPK